MSLETIEKMIKENDKQWTKRTNYEGVALFSFFLMLICLLIVSASYEDILATILTVSVYLPVGVIILAFLIIKSAKLSEKNEYMKDALWIYKNWVHDNKLDDGFYRYVHPKNYNKEALTFLAIETGVILKVDFNHIK